MVVHHDNGSPCIGIYAAYASVHPWHGVVGYYDYEDVHVFYVLWADRRTIDCLPVVPVYSIIMGKVVIYGLQYDFAFLLLDGVSALDCLLAVIVVDDASG